MSLCKIGMPYFTKTNFLHLFIAFITKIDLISISVFYLTYSLHIYFKTAVLFILVLMKAAFDMARAYDRPVLY